MNLERIRKILPERIRAFRISKAMTQEQLAEKVDIHTTYVSRIESGKRLPALTIICKIADILELDVDDLLTDEAKIASYDHKRKKLMSILKESNSSNIDIYSTVLNAFYKQHKRRKR